MFYLIKYYLLSIIFIILYIILLEDLIIEKAKISRVFVSIFDSENNKRNIIIAINQIIFLFII